MILKEKYRQVHTGPHGNLKNHPYGENGEHKHEYVWNEDGSLKRTVSPLI